MPETKFAGRNPFQPKKKPTRIDPATLAICNDPPPTNRAKPEGKYSEVFAKLSPGQCIKCEPEEAPKLATALGKWLKDKKKPGTVQSTKHYEKDGKGRVWLMRAEPLRRAA